MPLLYRIAAVRAASGVQKGPQVQEVIGRHDRGGRQAHGGTGGAVEHPIGQFEWEGPVIVVEPAADHAASAADRRGNDVDESTEPRMPGVADLAGVADMCLV